MIVAQKRGRRAGMRVVKCVWATAEENRVNYVNYERYKTWKR